MVFDLRHWLLWDLRQLLAFGLELEHHLYRFGAYSLHVSKLPYHKFLYVHILLVLFLWRTLTYTRMMSKREKMPGPLIISSVNELTNSNYRLYSQFLLCHGQRRREEIFDSFEIRNLLLLVTCSQKHNLTITVMETLYWVFSMFPF